MPRRDAVPLYKSRHVAFVEAIHDADNSDKSMVSHLAVGTGARADTICHTHSSWFTYGEDGGLYYRVPHSDSCRKFGNSDPCGDCKNNGHEKFEPKTPAGEGRRILLTNEWTNPVTGEKEYFGIKDAVEAYFAIDHHRAPSQAQHGNEMIDGDGTTKSTLNEWLRDIAAKSTIHRTDREEWLREVITIEDKDDREVDQIYDYGMDEDGNSIPDIFAHDMRATFCTQLMRNDVPRTKAINKTGHKVPATMDRYVAFHEKEIGEDEERDYY